MGSDYAVRVLDDRALIPLDTLLSALPDAAAVIDQSGALLGANGPADALLVGLPDALATLAASADWPIADTTPPADIRDWPRIALPEGRHAALCVRRLDAERRLVLLRPIDAPVHDAPVHDAPVHDAPVHDAQPSDMLRDTSARLSAMIVHAPEAVLLEDECGRILLVNEAFCLLAGVASDPVSLYGRSSEELWRCCAEHAQNPQRFRDSVQACRDSRRLVTAQPVRFADGGVIERDFVPILVDGVYRGAKWRCRDATERTRLDEERAQAQALLTEANHFIRQITDAVPLVVYVNDIVAMRNIYVSPGIHARFGYSPAEVTQLGDRVFDHLVHPDDLSIIQQQVARMRAASGDAMVPMEFRARHADGSWRWVRCHEAVFRRDADDLPCQVLGVIADITEQRQMQLEREEALERLTQANRFIQGIADDAPILVYVYRLTDGAPVYVNRKAQETVGYGADEVLEMNRRDLVRAMHPDDRQSSFDHLRSLPLLAEGEHRLLQYRVRHRDGSYRWLQSRETAFRRDSDGCLLEVLGVAEDITAQKSAEDAMRDLAAALRDSEDRFRAALQNSPITVFNQDAQLRYTWLYNRTHTTPASVLGKTDSDLWPARDVHALTALKSRVLQTGEGLREEIRLSLQGRRRCYDMALEPVIDGHGAVVGISGVAVDITDQSQARESVEHLIREARCLLWFAEITQVRDGVYDWKVNIPWKTSLRGFFNLEDSGDPFYTWRNSIDRDAFTAMDQQAREALGSGAPGYSQEYPYRDRDSCLKWMREDVRLTRIGENRWQAVGVLTDVTERRQTEDTLAHLVREAHCVLWYADIERKDGEFAWNLQVPARIQANQFLNLDLPAGDPITPWHAGVDDVDLRKMESRARAALEGGEPGYVQEYQFRDSANRRRWLREDVRLEPVAESRWRAVGVLTDVTERRRLEVQLVESEKLAALGVLVAGIAHEVNNPLTAVSGCAQLLEMHPDAGVRDDAKTIRKMSDRATRVLRALLTYARGTQSGDRMRCTLKHLVDETLIIASPLLRQAQVQIELRHVGESVWVDVDASQIEQVVLNLLSNAEHALREQDPENRVVTLETGMDARGMACIKIIDNGPGIPDHVRARIFDPFFTTKDIGEGTGLGLSISQGIATTHGGLLDVESPPEGGAAFVLRLPQVAE